MPRPRAKLRAMAVTIQASSSSNTRCILSDSRAKPRRSARPSAKSSQKSRSMGRRWTMLNLDINIAALNRNGVAAGALLALDPQQPLGAQRQRLCDPFDHLAVAHIELAAVSQAGDRTTIEPAHRQRDVEVRAEAPDGIDLPLDIRQQH